MLPDINTRSYTPYGDSISANTLCPVFNGESADLMTGVHHLGNGYRAYDPVLQRFQAPDSRSPFGSGGINCYAYCEGDPINNSDPSGHTRRRVLKEGSHFGSRITSGIANLGGALPALASLIGRASTTVTALITSGGSRVRAAGEFVGHRAGKIISKREGVVYPGIRIGGGGDNASIYKIKNDDKYLLKIYENLNEKSERMVLEMQDFNHYYGEGAAVIVEHPDTTYRAIKMKKISGVPLNKISSAAFPENVNQLFENMLQNLIKKNIIHTDLSKGNILWDAKEKSFNPIDFSYDESRIGDYINDPVGFYSFDRNTRWSREYVNNKVLLS